MEEHGSSANACEVRDITSPSLLVSSIASSISARSSGFSLAISTPRSIKAAVASSTALTKT